MPKPKLIDLTGQRVGRWEIIKEVERRGVKRYWLCRCECGTKKEVYMATLRNGKSQSCGCLRNERNAEMNTLDVTGQRFGRLVALEIVDKHKTKSVNIWKCLCDCGRHENVRIDLLTAHSTRSCGCLKKEQDEININEKLMERYIDGVATPSLRKRIRTDSKSGVKGVTWSKRDKVWRASISIKGKQIYLGQSKDVDAMIKLRKAAEKIYHKSYLDREKEIFNKKKRPT